MSDDAGSTTAEQTPAIPAFALYGESASTDPGQCHVELIETRSGPRDWRISPHLHRGLVQVIFVLAGAMDISIDGAESRLIGPVALTVPMGTVHGFHFEIGSDGFVFTLRDTMLADASFDLQAVSGALFSQPVELDLTDMPAIANRLQALSGAMLSNQGSDLSDEALLSQKLMMFSVLSSLDEVRRLQARTANQPEAGRGVWNRFQTLLNASFLEHWPVSEYAARLNVSESTLDRLCRDLAGKSAFRLIQERLVLEARRRLAYTRSSASEIAHVLGFSDLAYFSRFFKKETGQSPTAYRNSMQDWR